jgi:hypothetical protein
MGTFVYTFSCIILGIVIGAVALAFILKDELKDIFKR